MLREGGQQADMRRIMPTLGLHGRRIPSSRRAVLGNAWQPAKWVPA